MSHTASCMGSTPRLGVISWQDWGETPGLERQGASKASRGGLHRAHGGWVGGDQSATQLHFPPSPRGQALPSLPCGRSPARSFVLESKWRGSSGEPLGNLPRVPGPKGWVWLDLPS